MDRHRDRRSWGAGGCRRVLFATGRFVVRREPNSPYRTYRQDVGRAILLGLEFLVAGDIIRTVVVAPTLQNVVVLGIIVLIRTFLSLSLQLEIEGKLPLRRDVPNQYQD